MRSGTRPTCQSPDFEHDVADRGTVAEVARAGPAVSP
jgi:hypothetical protein